MVPVGYLTVNLYVL